MALVTWNKCYTTCTVTLFVYIVFQGNDAFCKDMYTQERLEIGNGNCYENYRSSKDGHTARQKMKNKRDQERVRIVEILLSFIVKQFAK